MSDYQEDSDIQPSAPGATSSATLEEALAKCQIALLPEQVRLLDQYFQLRREWNQKMNLTRHDTYDQFVARDVVDSLSFMRCLQPDEVILDVGTGSGVPGVILSILRPDLCVVLSETVGKRARAVADIVSRLGLKIPMLIGRAEKYLEAGGWEFHSLVIRAVAPLLNLLRWFRPYWDCFDRMLILKGPRWVTERGQARHYGLMHGLALRVVDRYTIPGTGAESVLLQICPEERLIPPRECRFRKLSCEEMITGVVESPQPGPFAKKGTVPPAAKHQKKPGPKKPSVSKGPGKNPGRRPK